MAVKVPGSDSRVNNSSFKQKESTLMYDRKRREASACAVIAVIRFPCVINFLDSCFWAQGKGRGVKKDESEKQKSCGAGCYQVPAD